MPLRSYLLFLLTAGQIAYGQTNLSPHLDSIATDSTHRKEPAWVNTTTQLQEATFNHPKMSVITNPQGQPETLIEIRHSSFRNGTTFVTKRYKGSIFFVDQFRSGQIRIANGQLLTLPLHYNLLRDQVTILVNNKEVEVFNARFILDQHSFIPLPRERGYAELLYAGRLHLLKKYSCGLVPLRPSEEAPPERALTYSGEVAKQTTYWLLLDGKLRQVELTKESLSVILGHRNSEFDRYLANAVDSIDESVLIYLLKAYEESNFGAVK